MNFNVHLPMLTGAHTLRQDSRGLQLDAVTLTIADRQSQAFIALSQGHGQYRGGIEPT